MAFSPIQISNRGTTARVEQRRPCADCILALVIHFHEPRCGSLAWLPGWHSNDPLAATFAKSGGAHPRRLIGWLRVGGLA
jgi:hypothetical protein